jgi:hypothetical protein
MEITVNIDEQDAYDVITIGIPAGMGMVMVAGHTSRSEVAIIGSPAELRRLARALQEAAAGPPLGPPSKGNGDPRP